MANNNAIDVPGAVGQNGASIYSADTGATNSYVVTLVPAVVAYTTGMTVNFKSATTSQSGTSTINVNGLGTKSILKNAASTIAAGNIVAGQVVTAMYDGTNFQMQSQTAVVVPPVATQAVVEAATSTNTYVAPGRMQFHPGCVKVWALIDASGTLISGYNIETITKSGTGKMNIDFVTDMSSANYATIVTTQAADSTVNVAYVSNTSPPQTTDVTVCNVNAAGTLTDPVFWNVMCLGDQ